MLIWRLILGTIFIAILIALGWLDAHMQRSGVFLIPLAALVALIATQEMLALAAAGSYRPVRWPVYVGNLALVLVNFLHAGQEFLLPILGGFLFVAFVCEIFRYRGRESSPQPGTILGNLAIATFALCYVGLMLALVVRLRLEHGIGALASLLVVVKFGDIGAYTVGRLIGRHKLAPYLSPGKTIEGGVGAILFSLLGAWLTLQFLCAPHAEPAQPFLWIPYGILVGVAGMLGDLAESLLKRDAGVKDSSTWLPGFGGVLDMADSVLLAAPVALILWAC